MENNITVRVAEQPDLKALLSLYAHLKDEPAAAITSDTEMLWRKLLADPGYHIIVAEEAGGLVSSCTVVVIRNLTHGERPYALIENVVTHKAHRQKGLASKCLAFAQTIANRENCYKIMLLTGAKKPETLQFYEKAGYNKEDKTAFIKWL